MLKIKALLAKIIQKLNTTSDNLGDLKTLRKSRSGTGSITFTANGVSNAILVTCGANTNAKGMWFINSASSGSFTIENINAASSITVAGSSGVLTVTSNVSTAVQAMLFIINGSYT